MKKLSFPLLAFVFFLTISCTKNNSERTACTGQYVYPTLKFKVIDKTTRADLFFSSTPTYLLSDIKIIFKNGSNRSDPIRPTVVSRETSKYFSFTAPRVLPTDTCIIKIKALKSDTLVYTIARSSGTCPLWFVNGVIINRSSPPVTLMINETLSIPKDL
ncbi:hypothetical protein LLH06_10720 [Mucilaginibacter daejeonensis]|uniref:hypothetical protein n=1 Tax=Mucilaginibacter daejeonensis TaxID=398049 RepID=UPI001D170009|nr:hypothetical protein [Mucilaginibacter daejeonensis]UEG51446.1 hypothetical protein LLH06_10720 [Mucilaginibacter daejeonensis]